MGGQAVFADGAVRGPVHGVSPAVHGSWDQRGESPFLPLRLGIVFFR